MRVYGALVGELEIQMSYKQRTLPAGDEIAYPSSVLGLDHKDETQLHVLVREYRNSIADYSRVCKLAIDAGIAAAHVRIEAEKAQILAQALQAVLHDLELTPVQRAKAPALLRRHLLALPGTHVTSSSGS